MEASRKCVALALIVFASCSGINIASRPASIRTQSPTEVELRIGMTYGPRVGPDYENLPTPLFYGGGFLTKTSAFETLVGMDAKGRPTPGLALLWEISDDRKVWTFHLRPGARFHSGKRCDAKAVADHFRRLGSDEDMFIGAFRHLVSVEAVGKETVRFTLDRPYALIADLPLVNPMSIVASDAARDARPAVLDGTGPFTFESYDPMRRAVYRRFAGYGGRRPAIASWSLEFLVTGFGRSDVPVWALERGHVDAIVEGPAGTIGRDRARRLAEKPGFDLVTSPGSAVVLLVINHDRPPFDDPACRSFVASAINREAIIEFVEEGFAKPVDTLFAPGIADWPDRRAAPPAPAAKIPAGLVDREPVLLVSGSDTAALMCGIEISRQLAAQGVRLRVESTTSGRRTGDRVNHRDYDLHLTRTWGMPYDPHSSLVSRLTPPFPRKTAVETVPFYTHPELSRLIDASLGCLPGAEDRKAVYATIQDHLDREVALIPLYIPDRIALTSDRVQGLALGPNGYGLDLSKTRRR